MSMSRRRFLRALGWSTAGITVVAGPAYSFSPLPVLPHRKAPTAADAAAWLRLRGDGFIELMLPRAEIGQGIAISLRQIVSEETGFPLDRIVAEAPRTDRLPPVRATVGSDSIKDFGPLVAQAAAALAAVLEREGVAAGASPAMGWAALASAPRLVDAAAVTTARPRSFDRNAVRRVVGQPHATDAVRAIVTADRALYADDVRLPEMVFGAALRPPRLGAALVSVDDAKAKGIAGYLGLHRLGDQAFVAAESRGALERARDAVTARWTGGDATQADLDRAIDIDTAMQRGALEHVVARAAISENARFDVDLRLDVAMAAHACMEPRTAVADFSRAGALNLWTGTQDVTFVRDTLARSFSLATSNVIVQGCRVGGGFGGKTIVTVELEAATLARALGRPVKVQWTRADEFREGFHRPPSSHRVRARLAGDGTIEAWHHAFRSGHVIFTSAAMGPVLQFATSFVGDPGVTRGAAPPYGAKATRVEFEDVRLPVHTGPWRGLGAAPNVWAIETAIDQLARRREEDPIVFRQRNIKSEWSRLARVLDRVAVLSEWRTRRSTARRGFGVACGVYKEMSYAAVVAEVVREREGFRVSRLWCAHDCGQMVNPDQVRAQVEGNLVWGVGMALSEQLTIAEGHVAETTFADYALPRFSEVPAMSIDLVDAGEPSSGAGETAIVAAAPAITNAIAAMTGQAVARLPASALRS
jgi:isoquinoline 1-oxidoreductase subunit beta